MEGLLHEGVQVASKAQANMLGKLYVPLNLSIFRMKDEGHKEIEQVFYGLRSLDSLSPGSVSLMLTVLKQKEKAV